MEKFYFTYGLYGHPFVCGWTEIVAPDEVTAREIFSVFHANRDSFLNCASVYTEEEFKKTKMYTYGNLGARCHERITVSVEKFDE